MEAQEIFDTVVRHLIKQGRPAMAPKVPTPNDPSKTTCVYRAPGGLKCAYGVLLHDDEYRPFFDLETMSVESLHNRGLLPSRHIPHVRLLQALQDAHDTSGDDGGTRFSFGLLASDLASVAEAFRLNPAVLSEMPED